MSLKNATALITGGAQGFGKAFARIILEAGGKVSLVDILCELGSNTQNEFNKLYGSGSVLFIKCDVGKKLDLEDAFKKTYDTFGSLDLVVNNAGVVTKDENWERTIDINLTAVLRGSLLAAQYMRKDNGGRGGHIINIASTAGLYAVPFDPAYAASKHGVVGLSRSLSMILSPLSVRVNCLCPSFANTSLFETGLLADSCETDSVFKKLVATVGVQKVEDVAVAFEKLLQDDTATGGVMYVTPRGAGYAHQPLKL